MRVTIAKKLWLSFAVLILILGVSGSISYLQIEKLNSALTQFLSTHEPLENALLEMEVSIEETAISVLAFVRDGNRIHIENLHRFQETFETFLNKFNRLAVTVPEKTFGREAVGFFKEHRALSKEIIVLAEDRERAQKAFTEMADQMSIMIDQYLSAAPNQDTPTPSNPRIAAMLMKISFHRLFSAIESYVIQQKPILKTEISAAEEAYKKWKNRYAQSGLSPAAKDISTENRY